MKRTTCSGLVQQFDRRVGCKAMATVFYLEREIWAPKFDRRYMARCKEHPMDTNVYHVIDEAEFIVWEIMEQ